MNRLINKKLKFKQQNKYKIINLRIKKTNKIIIPKIMRITKQSNMKYNFK